MLEADKAAFVATLQQQSLEIRQKELSFYLERYANLSSTASIIAGFAFTGLATTRIPASASGWLAGGYWVAGSLCMTFSTYVVIIAGFSSVYGERLALQVAHPVPELAAPPRLPLPLTPPPHRAVHAPSILVTWQGTVAGAARHAVKVLESQRQSIFVVFLCSILFQSISAIMITTIRRATPPQNLASICWLRGETGAMHSAAQLRSTHAAFLCWD